ncbi:dienelactone hydrolase family protein [Cupriavidus basilensis]|uniref:Dienelactone hydrolase-related enzymes n=1 Tax=Cupriavidus basilensis TaxID=68895 RepID=A0A0C4Y467_9BURK|nr:prolyl oligopeptidase family serine peptidase [Cupriavidus basilensis]AJG17598.1 Dienelactone hydrolase-related enzymes [Cupriavidus basilensis]
MRWTQRLALALLLTLPFTGAMARAPSANQATQAPETTIAAIVSGSSEQVAMVPKPGVMFSLELETTIFKPPGDGPFALVVINHGKALGKPAFQSRARYLAQSAEFVKRGYVVALPMRQGFSKSGGAYVGGGCNVESNGLVQAEDVVATLEYMIKQPYVDKSRIVVIGQSHGGLTTMAFSTIAYPGVLGVVNFAGGLRDESCSRWEFNLVDAFGDYGKKARYPSLWLYGDNDSYWPPPLPAKFFEAYTAQARGPAANARMVDYGTFAGDSHTLFGARAGVPIWLPEVGRFFKEIGLSFDPQP